MGSIFHEIYKVAKDTEGYMDKIFMTIGIILVALLIYYIIKKISVKVFIKKKDRMMMRNWAKWILFFPRSLANSLHLV